VKLFRTPIPCRSHILFAVIVAVVLVCLHNWRFWQQTFESVRPASAGDAWFIVSLFLLLVFIHACAGLLFPGRRALPIIAALLFIVAALAGYFRDTFGVIIDKDMIRNVVRTDVREASDFVSLRLVLYMVGLGLIPALVAARVRLPASVSDGNLSSAAAFSPLDLLLWSWPRCPSSPTTHRFFASTGRSAICLFPPNRSMPPSTIGTRPIL